MLFRSIQENNNSTLSPMPKRLTNVVYKVAQFPFHYGGGSSPTLRYVGEVDEDDDYSNLALEEISIQHLNVGKWAETKRTDIMCQKCYPILICIT